MKAFKNIAAAVLASTLACLPALAQTPASAGMQMTPAARQEVVDTLIRAVTDKYIFADTAHKVAQAIRQEQQRGAYDGIASPELLADALTRRMQAAANDKHLRVVYSAQAIPERTVQSDPSAEEIARRVARCREMNFGVHRVEQLPLNIGYLDLVGFAPVTHAADTLAAAMTVLAHTDALIIDLRNNYGGDASTAALLASYLFDRRTHLNDFHHREGKRVEQRWTSDVVPGVRYGQQRPVYVLTSRDTFSAAEDFAYNLKHLKRVTVVGETSGGGANAGNDVRLLPHFSAFIPLSRIVSPVTQSNWEGVGVAPDLRVCADDALRSAQVAILTAMAQSEPQAARRDQLKERIAALGPARAGGACP